MIKLKALPIKKGRRTLGSIYEVSGGRLVYLAARRVGDIYRAKERNIAEAIRKNVACWAVENDVIIQMQSRGVGYVGVLVRETGDRFLAPIAVFLNHTTVRIMSVPGRGGIQRCVGLHSFARRPGKILKRR